MSLSEESPNKAHICRRALGAGAYSLVGWAVPSCS